MPDPTTSLCRLPPYPGHPPASVAPGWRVGWNESAATGSASRSGLPNQFCQGDVWPGQVGHHAVSARRSRPARNLGPQTGRSFSPARRVRGHRHQRARRARQRAAAALRAAHASAGSHSVAQPRQRQSRSGQPDGDDWPRSPAQRPEPGRLPALIHGLPALWRRAQLVAQTRCAAHLGPDRSAHAAL